MNIKQTLKDSNYVFDKEFSSFLEETIVNFNRSKKEIDLVEYFKNHLSLNILLMKGKVTKVKIFGSSILSFEVKT